MRIDACKKLEKMHLNRRAKRRLTFKNGFAFSTRCITKIYYTFSRVKETFFIAKNTVALFVQDVFIQHAETCLITLKDSIPN